MPSAHLKHFRQLWGSTCNGMWHEIAAIYALETHLRYTYGTTGPEAPITRVTYAPGCEGRLNHSIAASLKRLPALIDEAVMLRVVMLSAGFEAYFEEFLGSFLRNRKKYYAAGALTTDGNRVQGNVRKCAGPKARVLAFGAETGAGIKEILPQLGVVQEMYALRNCLAHDAGICDAGTKAQVTVVPVQVGRPLRVEPEFLVTTLAEPCIRTAEVLDRKI